MEIHLLANLGSWVQRRYSSFFHRYCHLDIFPESKDIEREVVESMFKKMNLKHLQMNLPSSQAPTQNWNKFVFSKKHCAKKIWKFRWPWWAQDRGKPKRHPLGQTLSSGRLQRATEPWWSNLLVVFFFGRCTLGVVESGILGQRFCSSSSI